MAWLALNTCYIWKSWHRRWQCLGINHKSIISEVFALESKMWKLFPKIHFHFHCLFTSTGCPKKVLYFLSIRAQSKCDPDPDHILIGPGLTESITLFLGQPIYCEAQRQTTNRVCEDCRAKPKIKKRGYLVVHFCYINLYLKGFWPKTSF